MQEAILVLGMLLQRFDFVDRSTTSSRSRRR